MSMSAISNKSLSEVRGGQRALEGQDLLILNLPEEVLERVLYFAANPRASDVCKKFAACNVRPMRERYRELAAFLENVPRPLPVGNPNSDHPVFLVRLMPQVLARSSEASVFRKLFGYFDHVCGDVEVRPDPSICAIDEGDLSDALCQPKPFDPLIHEAAHVQWIKCQKERDLLVIWPKIREIFAQQNVEGLPSPDATPAAILAWSQAPENRHRFDAVTALSCRREWAVMLNDVPPILREFRHLTELDLRNNRIRLYMAPCFRAFPNLQKLDLSGNAISHLPRGVFQGLSQLTHLDLSNNRQSGFSLRIGEGVFDPLQQLRVLNLSRNEMEPMPNNALQGLSHLEELDISGSQVVGKDGGSVTLPNALKIVTI